MVTDLIMVFEYSGKGKASFAMATLACIGLNISLQSASTYFQRQERSASQHLKEQLFVWTLVKPGVDAWRVASDSEVRIYEERSEKLTTQSLATNERTNERTKNHTHAYFRTHTHTHPP